MNLKEIKARLAADEVKIPAGATETEVKELARHHWSEGCGLVQHAIAAARQNKRPGSGILPAGMSEEEVLLKTMVGLDRHQAITSILAQYREDLGAAPAIH